MSDYEGMKALIVEDDSPERFLLEEQIRSLGHDVTACSDVETALEVYQRTFFPLVMIDLSMPGGEGLGLCRRIRLWSPEDRSIIVLIIGPDELKNLQAALEAGADEYLLKPVRMEVLQARLLIIERQIHNSVRRKHNMSGAEINQQSLTLHEAVEAFEKHFITQVLEHYHWRKIQTARALGIERRTLYRKIKKFGLG